MFKLDQKREKVVAKREIVRTFAVDTNTAILVFLKGSYWGTAAPPDIDDEEKEGRRDDAIYHNRDGRDKCVHEVHKMSDIADLVTKFETRTYTK